jgi:hypothetical protein
VKATKAAAEASSVERNEIAASASRDHQDTESRLMKKLQAMMEMQTEVNAKNKASMDELKASIAVTQASNAVTQAMVHMSGSGQQENTSSVANAETKSKAKKSIFRSRSTN